ncbi:MAG: hypothetical protein IJU81_02520 [Bacteroidales bacterium]|nr:hypothetical protein [Bacteroidales bacterium]
MSRAQNIDRQSLSNNNKWALTYSIARKNQMPPFADEVFASEYDLDNYLAGSAVVYDGQVFKVVNNDNTVSFFYAKWDSGNDCYVKEPVVPQGNNGGTQFNYENDAQQDVINDIKLRAIPPRRYFYADLAVANDGTNEKICISSAEIRDSKGDPWQGVIKSNGYYHIDGSNIVPSNLGADPELHLQLDKFVDNTVVEIVNLAVPSGGYKLMLGEDANSFAGFLSNGDFTANHLHPGLQGNIPFQGSGDIYVFVFFNGYYLLSTSPRTYGMEPHDLNASSNIVYSQAVPNTDPVEYENVVNG